jgi:pyruvate dehydrogenase E2 component (dihydrolipoamide acetyltransferase)
MATEIKMPQLGETVVEGTITRWLKKEGDTVATDEYIVEISTDKVDSEIPSTASGVIQKILVPEGETVSVGTAIAVVGEEGEAAGGAEAEEDQQAAPEAEEKEQPEAEEKEQPEAEEKEQPEAEEKEQHEAETEEKEEPAAEPAAADKESPPRAEREAAPKEPSAEEQTPRHEPPPPPSDADTSKRGIISPLVRRLAEENDVNLDEVSGTGTGGRIRKQDVLRFVEERKARPAARPAASAEPAPEPAPTPEEKPAAAVGGREELVPWTNIRRRTAEHMVASHLETARAWNAVEVDWTDIVRLRERAKGPFREREGFGLTYMPFLAKALCETLLEMPVVNSTYDKEQQGNRLKYFVNLGIAVALEGGGLIVPVVKGADERNLVGLARGINDVATRARSKKLSPDDLAGGTFTITNPGPFGSIISVPIIPQGQTAIVGFEAIQKRVVATEDDSIAVRQMGFLSMSWDHRAIDGAEAARFLAALRERIESTDFSPELAAYL